MMIDEEHMRESLRRIALGVCYCGRYEHEICAIGEARIGLGETRSEARRGIVMPEEAPRPEATPPPKFWADIQDG